MNDLLTLLMILQGSATEQTRFLIQGSRYMDGPALCQWYLDLETNKLYKLTLEETTIEEALELKSKPEKKTT
jgi:hypothetical protein